VVWAGLLADIERGTSGSEIAAEHLDRALRDYKPSFDPIEQELIALISLQMASFHSLLPWMGVQGLQPGKSQWPSYLDDIVDPATGQLDAMKLEVRIQALRGHRASRSALA
jgi:hypothetical protein